MMLSFIELAVQGGAIALGAYSLWMIGTALRTKADITKNRLKLFWSALIAALLIVGGFLYLEVARTNRQEVDNAIRDLIATVRFDPIKGKYPFGTTTGLEPVLADEQKFNLFNGIYLVKGLWADSSYPMSWIRANKASDGLLLEFVRQGYGVDVMIPPHDNQPRSTRRFDKILITLKNLEDKEVAFRLRLVDERNTHWVWGTERADTKDSVKIAIDYSIKDSSEPSSKDMSLSAGSEATFSFSLNKEGWEVFPNDGNAGLPNKEGKFGAVQLVVIEPGSPNVKEIARGDDHRKYLAANESPIKLLVKEISFGK